MNDDFEFRLVEETSINYFDATKVNRHDAANVNYLDVSGINYLDASYFNYLDVIHGIENTLGGLGLFVADAGQSGYVLYIKSSIRYVHRPELKYEIRILREDKTPVGMINVILRSHDIGANRTFAEFVKIWINLERRYLTHNQGEQIVYRTDVGYFGRRIYRPRTADRGGGRYLGEAISSYIRAFDELLKYYISRGNDDYALERLYYARLKDGRLTI